MPVSPRRLAPLPLLLLVVLSGGCRSCAGGDTPLTNPDLATEQAPELFDVKLTTTKGDVVVRCRREWAPSGSDRFYNLVKLGFFDDVAFFRVVKSPTPFIAQFGIHGDPDVSVHWRDATIPSDPVTASNKRGTLTFAMAGAPTTRTTQLFFNLASNTNLDRAGFAPICEVTGDGMKIVDALHGGYGEGVDQNAIQSTGNKLLREKFPELDYIQSARLVDPAPAAPLRSSSPLTQ